MTKVQILKEAVKSLFFTIIESCAAIPYMVKKHFVPLMRFLRQEKMLCATLKRTSMRRRTLF